MAIYMSHILRHWHWYQTQDFMTESYDSSVIKPVLNISLPFSDMQVLDRPVGGAIFRLSLRLSRKGNVLRHCFWNKL